MYITANVGTPKSIPIIPNKPPPSSIENTTQNGVSPVDSPRILGPIILPSSCCNSIINTINIRPFLGSASRISIALGTAPIFGQKNGIRLVTPTIVLTSIV